MAIVGMSYTNINVQRNEGVRGSLEVINRTHFTNVEKAPLTIGATKTEVLKFTFEFSIDYKSIGKNESAGTIVLSGDVVSTATPDEMKNTLESWNKDKKISKDMTFVLMHYLVPKCNVQAIVLSRDVNLPPPFPLPEVKRKSAK